VTFIHTHNTLQKEMKQQLEIESHPNENQPTKHLTKPLKHHTVKGKNYPILENDHEDKSFYSTI
jgi:hypothetical protein